jgi:hypothetical protein
LLANSQTVIDYAGWHFALTFNAQTYFAETFIAETNFA